MLLIFLFLHFFYGVFIVLKTLLKESFCSEPPDVLHFQFCCGEGGGNVRLLGDTIFLSGVVGSAVYQTKQESLVKDPISSFDLHVTE